MPENRDTIKVKGVEIPMPRLSAKGTGRATPPKPAAGRKLGDYPLLVYAPAQHGPGVRTEDKGLPIGEVADDYARSGDAEATAVALGTTAEHVRQAVQYLVDSGAAESE